MTGFIKSDASLDSPNLQIYFVPMLVNYDGTALNAQHGYQATAMLARPKSRGRLVLRSADPRSHPRLNFNYLTDPDDVEVLVQAIRIVRSIFARPPLAKFRGTEIYPSSDVSDDHQLVDFIRETAKSTHHLCGTCAMGTADGSVVNPEGKVNGVTSLRIIDASIMPVLPATNLNAPTIMMAEKLSDTIRHPI